jgi:hypothetical protein
MRQQRRDITGVLRPGVARRIGTFGTAILSNSSVLVCEVADLEMEMFRLQAPNLGGEPFSKLFRRTYEQIRKKPIHASVRRGTAYP